MPVCRPGPFPSVDNGTRRQGALHEPAGSSTTHTTPRGGRGGRSELAVLGRATGVAGILTVVVVIGASLVEGYENQSMTATSPAILRFFRSLDDRLGWLMSYVTIVGLIACLWFAIGLALCLRQHERGVPWRSAFLAAAGVVSVVSSQIASWDVAVFRSGTIDPHVATYAYDLGGISFANSWVAAGAVGICAGLVMLRAPAVPSWVAGRGLIAGVGEVLARGLVPARLRLRAFRALLGLGYGGVSPADHRSARTDKGA